MQMLLLIQDTTRLKTLFFLLFIFALTANVYSQLNDLSNQEQWSKIEIENLSIVNSASEDFSPHIWSNYLVYIGLQERSGFGTKSPEYFDIKASILNDSLDLKNFIFNPELNSRFHEGPISWDQKNNTLYFTRANTDNEQPIVDSNGRQLLQIYKAEYAQGKWQNIVKMNFCTEEENYCHPAIFNEGRSMIFASSIEGGSGKMDLYRTDRISELTWSIPTNLGKQINNPGNDWFPFVYKNYLFHATDVKDGQGLDIYLSKLDKDGKPSPAFRLPAPINSEHDDFGLVISIEKNVAYFSSNRPGGKGKDDIYKIVLDKALEKTSVSAMTNTDKLQSTKKESSNSEAINTVATNTQSVNKISISITDSRSKSSISEAEVIVYALPKTAATSFSQQLESNNDVLLLENMAANISSYKNYISNSAGKLDLIPVSNQDLFLVIKKSGYQPSWKYIPAGSALMEYKAEMVR